MLRLHLPPNLAAAAPRDAIAVKVDVDLSGVPPPQLVPALALLQRWCGTATPPKFLQLTRAQLRELAAAVGAEPVFVENGRATVWHHDALVADPVSPSPGPPPAGVRAAPRSPGSKPAAISTPPLQVDGSEHYLAISLPSREHPAYAAAVDLVKSNGFILEPSNRKWWLRDRHKTLNFLAANGTRLRDEFGAQFTANFTKNTSRILPARIACEAAPAGDEFAVTLALEAGSASDDAVRSALSASRGYVEVDGKVFLLDAAKVRQLETAQRALAGTPSAALTARRSLRIGAARIPEAQEILETLSPEFQPPETWRARSDALRNLSRLAPAPLPTELEAQLRPYQRLGAAWLWHLFRHDLGGILADEMGLGKTLQALALLSAAHRPAVNSEWGGTGVSPVNPSGTPMPRESTPLLRNSSPRPSLVVCPASLLENWRREAARFAPQLRVFVHHGERRLGSAADFAGLDLVVTSYGTLTRDWERFAAVRFTAVIADEAQHIKNRRTQNAAALRSLRARSRFVLTGTPVENSLGDLRSLFEFLLPGYLDPVPAGVRADERAWFDERLRARVAPYILRRTKQAVAPELPARLEQTLWCELTPAQAALYRETQQNSERALFDLEASGASEAQVRFAALTQLLRLRQICCDPRLLAGTGSERHGRPVHDQGSDAGATPASSSTDPQLSSLNSQPGLFPDSAKLDALRELLEEAIDDGHRVLVFSQFTSLLALLREELTQQQTPHCYLDGSMPPRARQAEVDRFQSSPDVPVFLISLKAGGTGLNLTGADTVVHFDPWWNPAAEAQATDRAHRIGQTRVVTSYKLIASGTVEEKVLALQEEKRALLADVFDASDAAAAKLSLADLKDLLR